LYPFGHGLSYSRFEYSDLVISGKQASAGKTVEITCNITNISNIKGDEVVQLYCRDVYASIPRPVKELKGFSRVTLEPGQTKNITFKLPVNMIAFYDIDFDLVIESGSIEVMIGSSREDIRLHNSFEINGSDKSIIQDRIFVCPVEVKS
jgi:beta-glucosidase